MQYSDIEELKEKAICGHCVGDSYLSKEINRKGRRRKCRYCDKVGKSYTLAEIALLVESAFEVHYTCTATDPDGFEWAMQNDPEIDYYWEREGEQTADAIMNAADIPKSAAIDIQTILADEHADFDSAKMGEETPFDEDAYYEEIMPDNQEWQDGWNSFKWTIKSEARFFSRTAVSQLAALFNDIDQLQTDDGTPMVVDAGPGSELTHLYRARAFQSDDKLKTALMRPDLELAAPPYSIAMAGRMNAKGISTFYGAINPEIALAEVRPPVGSQVAIARFEIVRPLRLLNLNALEHIQERGSIFDPDYARRLGRMMFLKSLSQRMSRAVMPDDQDFEYLPTQVIADYLATEGTVSLDGIMFPSVQVNSEGVNVVLFHKASCTEMLNIPNGTELDARTWSYSEDGDEREYSVTECVPSPEPETPASNRFSPHTHCVRPSDVEQIEDCRQITLRIDPSSVKIHIVKAVKFETEDHKVTRHRWSKQDEDMF